MSDYPQTPGFQKGSATSEAAAEAMKPKAPKLRELILEAFVLSNDNGGIGFTADEMVDFVKHCRTIYNSTAAARFRELEMGGAIRKTETLRETRAGNMAHVYFLTGKPYQKAAKSLTAHDRGYIDALIDLKRDIVARQERRFWELPVKTILEMIDTRVAGNEHSKHNADHS